MNAVSGWCSSRRAVNPSPASCFEPPRSNPFKSPSASILTMVSRHGTRLISESPPEIKRRHGRRLVSGMSRRCHVRSMGKGALLAEVDTRARCLRNGLWSVNAWGRKRQIVSVNSPLRTARKHGDWCLCIQLSGRRRCDRGARWEDVGEAQLQRGWKDAYLSLQGLLVLVDRRVRFWYLTRRHGRHC